MNITQKEFAKRSGIPETTVSDWKKKKTNPTAEKIMIICKVLNVTPGGNRSNPDGWYAIDADTEAGMLITVFNSFDAKQQARLIGYAQALQAISDRKG